MNRPATKVINDAPEARGDGIRVVPSGTVAQQHFGPFDPAARISALEERIAALEAKVSDRQPPN
ncbi:MAG TPA: ABC transporter C-terminal domain-containing protein [Candidatus Binataceae bacterium]|nr:ABC transporter C-terminal domain-containing protein [Candidatus Binataceae bacterium]HVB80804.1 ABC transporter C-terminal domain-containing protein [Candidatus Binataceae bacterium]